LAEYVLAGSFLDELPTRLVGDKAYDSDKLDQRIKEEYDIEMIAPNRSRRSKTQDGRPLRRYRRLEGRTLVRLDAELPPTRHPDDTEQAAAIARAIVLGKVANCRTVLLRGAREHAVPAEAERLSASAGELLRLLPVIERSRDVDCVRGVEGDAARLYFSGFDSLILVNKDSFFYRERSRRPPLDNVNALLSFLYTLLTHDVAAALESVGLDPCVGYLHVDRPGRPGLALDLMEELRPVLVDRLALSLINRRQVAPNGFHASESGAVQMDDATRKQVLVAWQSKKQEEIVHPFINERIAFGLLPYVQALLMARHLRGDLDAYPPFFWR
jgi:CRISP-associated protein Cas1